MRRKCVAIVKNLDITVPLDVRRLADSIARSRGKPIHLMPSAVPNGAAGMWLSARDSDIILYERDTSPLHQEHIQLHELAHIVLGHVPVAETTLLFPDIDESVVARVLRRTTFTTDEERETELLATLILARTRRWRRMPQQAGPSDGAAISRRVAMSLEPPEDRA